jgi:hypothetical protein
MDYAVAADFGGRSPLFHLIVPADADPQVPCLDFVSIVRSVALASQHQISDTDLFRCIFRGTSWERLPVVLRTGIDVEPADAVFFADEFSKAVENGGWPKIMLALRREYLDRSYREVPSDTSPLAVNLLREKFATVLPSTDGKHLWLSRLPASHSALGTPYESEYAYWIPERAADALIAVIILEHPNHTTGTGPPAP